MNLRLRRSGLTQAVFVVLFGLLWLAGLSFYRGILIEDLSRRHLEDIRVTAGSPPDAQTIQPVQAQDPALEPWLKREFSERSAETALFQHGRSLEILVRDGKQGGTVYRFDASAVVWRMLLGLGFGVLLALLGLSFMGALSGEQAKKLTSLRAKFIVAMIAVNLISAAIVFWSLSALQTREQTERIEKQSMIFSEYSTNILIREFLDSFENAYYEKFLPNVRSLIASNDDLSRIRIFSAKNGRALFDSELTTREAIHETIQEFPQSFLEQIAARGTASRAYEDGGNRWYSVVSTFRGPNQEALFRVEYVYGYRSLERSLRSIRSQILLDLIPSLALGAIMALFFAQFLIRPIRKLAAAFGKVSSGDYSARVPVDRSDEIGDLVSAFNSMADELRRKQELRKYLSNFSYEQITKAVDMVAGDGRAEIPKLGGTRVSATILFCDIRDFVSLCEAMEAEEVTSLLNEYFSEMVAVIHKNGGEVDKFIGDAILAVFYPEEGRASEAATSLQAIYCALEMRARLAVFNERRKSVGKTPLEIGIGLSFGEIISGPIGAENRMDFTVIGDVVNVASRIEKLSKQGRHTKVLFSASVEVQVHGLLQYEEIPGGIRGKAEQIRVYELIGIKDLQLLIGQLSSNDPQTRARSVEVLGQSGNPEALAPALSALEDSDESVRILAALAISRLAPKNDDRAINALFQRLKMESSPRGAASFVASIGKICQNERVLELAPWLSSKDERLVANVVEAIGQAKTATGMDLILPKLESRNHRVKANAAMAAFSAGRIEVIDILKPMLMHSDPLMRSSAAFAIGELTLIADQKGLLEKLESDTVQTRQVLAELQECVPMLVALLKDPESMVKRQAVIALGKIRDRGSVLPLIGLLESPEVLPDVLDALRTIGSHRLVRELLAKMV